MRISRYLLISVPLCLGVACCTAQAPVPPPGAHIVAHTKDSLRFSNGVSASKNDLFQLRIYWALMLKRDSILSRANPGANLYKDPLHRRYQDSMLYYTRRLPPFLRNAKMDLRRYKDSL